MIRPWAAPLIPLYSTGLRLKNAFYNRRVLVPRRLTRPVISVGSLSAGGAGKTPVVIMLADLIQRQGASVNVLSRGYGRGSGAIEQVDPSGLATRFGDEPLELARAGLNVFVGAERFLAGQLAERHNPAALHLLDDGFQHRRLARDFDIVLLTAADIADSLLPGGNLREPLTSLVRADVVILRDSEAEALQPVVTRHTQAETWIIRRRIDLPPSLPKRLIAFCGIARPDSFFAMLRESGCELAGQVAFEDHHPYTAEDYLRLVEAALHTSADGFITTAKDAVKIPEVAMKKLSGIAPVLTARLQLSLLDEPQALQRIRPLLASA